MVDWKRSRILVTGATGFIGGRLCERLVVDYGANVHTLIHTYNNAARLGRLPVEMIRGDLLDRRSLAAAVQGCEYVVHLAYGGRASAAQGTRHLLEAAHAAGVKRFIHMSSASVYGHQPPSEPGGEDRRLKKLGRPYMDAKIAAEREVRRFMGQSGLPVVILRPFIVYGPYSSMVADFITRIRNGSLSLVDEGRGICNTVYVDNLVDAVFLALARDEAAGGTFFVADDEAVTWAEFLGALARMVSPEIHLPSVSSAEIRAGLESQGGVWKRSCVEARRLVASRQFMDMVRRIPVVEIGFQRAYNWYLGQPPERKQRIRKWFGRDRSLAVHAHAAVRPIPSREQMLQQLCAGKMNDTRARQVLGYRPRVGLAEGLELTRKWLEFERVIPAGADAVPNGDWT